MSTALERNIEEACSLLGSLLDLRAQVERAAEMIATALLSGHKLLSCGNGGSAADAAHLATEFVCRFNRDRRPYPAICLSTNGGDLTAIGNDYSFEDLFARQVLAFGLPGDVLIAFTTSGASKNIIAALREANRIGVKTISFLGQDGGQASGLATIELLVRHNVTARIQEAHQLIYHTICELVENRLQQD